MLLTIPNILPAKDINHILERLAQAPWQDGAQTAGALAQQVKANQQVDDQSPIAAELRQHILSSLGSTPQLISAALPLKIFPPKFNCYQGGGHYGLHTDSAMMTLPNGEYLRSDISATLFLSNPESYDGGELSIETQYGAQHVKLNAGDLVLYPSTSLHQVQAVTRGERVAVFFWIQSMVRNALQREQLFELDQSIQQLRVTLGADDNEVRRLSALYHNLLRDWAEV